MEEETEQLEVSQMEIAQGSGTLLANARKQQKKTVEEIARELNLSVNQIKTIELDQTDGLPEPTYVRGYIRGYAKLLGLNPEEILRNYLNPNWQQTSSLHDLPRGIGASEESDSGLLAPAKIVGLLVLIGVVSYFWFSGLLSDLIDSRSSNVETSAPNSPTDLTAQELAQGDAESNLTEVTTTPETETLAGGEKVIVNRLVLSFSDTSWVDIRDAQDNRLAYKSYVKDDELKVNSETPLSVFIGNAAAVLVEFNGSPFDISEFREGVYAKFKVGE